MLTVHSALSGNAVETCPCLPLPSTPPGDVVHSQVFGMGALRAPGTWCHRRHHRHPGLGTVVYNLVVNPLGSAVAGGLVPS
jgi:hypothetical protein